MAHASRHARLFCCAFTCLRLELRAHSAPCRRRARRASSQRLARRPARCWLIPGGSCLMLFAAESSGLVCWLTVRRCPPMLVQKCPPGLFAASAGSTQCYACPPGYASKAGSVACTPCAAGRYNEMMGQAECKACPLGYFSAAAGATSCEVGATVWAGGRHLNEGLPGLVGGYRCLAAPAVACHNELACPCMQACPLGKYSAKTGSSFCQPCAPGTASDLVGSAACQVGLGQMRQVSLCWCLPTCQRGQPLLCVADCQLWGPLSPAPCTLPAAVPSKHLLKLGWTDRLPGEPPNALAHHQVLYPCIISVPHCVQPCPEGTSADTVGSMECKNKTTTVSTRQQRRWQRLGTGLPDSSDWGRWDKAPGIDVCTCASVFCSSARRGSSQPAANRPARCGAQEQNTWMRFTFYPHSCESPVGLFWSRSAPLAPLRRPQAPQCAASARLAMPARPARRSVQHASLDDTLSSSAARSASSARLGFTRQLTALPPAR